MSTMTYRSKATLCPLPRGSSGRQQRAGITQPGDGEFGKAMSNAVDYGAWWGYSFQRVAGLALVGRQERLPPKRLQADDLGGR